MVQRRRVPNQCSRPTGSPGMEYKFQKLLHPRHQNNPVQRSRGHGARNQDSESTAEERGPGTNQSIQTSTFLSKAFHMSPPAQPRIQPPFPFGHRRRLPTASLVQCRDVRHCTRHPTPGRSSFYGHTRASETSEPHAWMLNACTRRVAMAALAILKRSKLFSQEAKTESMP